MRGGAERSVLGWQAAKGPEWKLNSRFALPAALSASPSTMPGISKSSKLLGYINHRFVLGVLPAHVQS